MSAFDVDALTARFRRAAQPVQPAKPTGPAQPARDGEGPEAVGSHPPPAAAITVAAPEGTPSPGPGRPRRRRWLPPTTPVERNLQQVAEPPTLYRCPHCGKDHQPFPMHGGGGMSALVDRSLDWRDNPHKSTWR